MSGSFPQLSIRDYCNTLLAADLHTVAGQLGDLGVQISDLRGCLMGDVKSISAITERFIF